MKGARMNNTSKTITKRGYFVLAVFIVMWLALCAVLLIYRYFPMTNIKKK